jgi:hypothetical protein
MQKYPGGTTDFLRADGTFASPGAGGQTNTVVGSNGITNAGDNVDADLRPTYGTSANTICQGNDARLTDSRTPLAHALDGALHTGNLVESKVTFSGTGHDHSGTTNGNLVDYGDLDNVPSAFAPSAHAIGGAAHTGVIEDLSATSVDTSQRLAPDGVGGVAFVSGGTAPAPENVWFEHFITSNTDVHEIGSHGWNRQLGGTGPSISVVTEAGHPGIIQMEAGTASAARGSLYMGDAVLSHCVLDVVQNDLDLEFLVKFKNSVAAADLERFVCGFGDLWDTGTGDIQHDNGVYVDFVGGSPPTFGITAANGGTRTSQAGTTTIALDTWYRIGIRMTYPGGTPTASLLVNGSVEGTPITTNIPSIGVAIGLKADAGPTVGTEMAWWTDWAKLTQVTYQED